MTDKDIKHDMRKMMDKIDDLDQKLYNLNFKFSQLIKNFEDSLRDYHENMTEISDIVTTHIESINEHGDYRAI